MADINKRPNNTITVKPLIIPDSFEGYPLNYFNVPLHYHDDLKSVFIPHGLIQDRIEALAKRIFDDLHIGMPEQLVCLCVLKSGSQFFSDLVLKLQQENRLRNDRSLPICFEFIHTRSYVNDQSSNHLEIIEFSDLRRLKDKNLLVVEHIIDRGITMTKLKKELDKYQPKNIRVVSLCIKRRKDKLRTFQPDYCGFEIPDHFVIGYALDYNEYFRDLDHICILKKSSFEKYKIKSNDEISQGLM